MLDIAEHERTTAQDQYFNYCWWPYEPIAATAGKLRPVSLLYRSFELANVADRGALWVEQLQRQFGDFRTVYGVKWNGSELQWECYFYDYERRERNLTANRFLRVVSSLARSTVTVNESLPYFMFSVDLNADILRCQREIDTLNLYLGNPGSSVSSGVSYAVTADETRLENFYFFFSAANQLLDAAAKIGCSVRIDLARHEIDQILRPELRHCQTICIANKRHADTAYFSGVTVDQLLHFLQWQQFPRELTDFVISHGHELDHLLYDVGFDYAFNGDRLEIRKSGFYGVF